jgi:hypothetical protein
MKKKIEAQLKVMEQMTQPTANIYNAFIEMTKLMKMFYEYLEKKKP